MEKLRTSMDRRDFLKQTVGAGLAAAVTAASGSSFGAEASGLPRRVLGKTGVPVSVLVFGGGSHFLGRVGGDEAVVEQLIHRARELGINYFDTAATYTYPPHERLSETYYGRILEPYRDEIFLSTKARERGGDGMLRSVETSLRLLRTDHIDLMQMHSLQRLEELDEIEGPDGALAALQRLKEEGVVRFIGITGHYNPEVLREAVRRLDVDTLLVSLNAAQASHPISMTPGEPLSAFEHEVLPAAVEKNLGVVAMKVMGQRILLDADEKGEARATPEELIRYVLSLPVAAAEISYTSLPILEQNVAAARNFRPMSEDEMAALRKRLVGKTAAWARFLRHHEDDVA
ncbi:MAG: aldo/keto reductase [Acidobacteriota bacterium]